jgi:hypothetical protein
MSQFIAFGEPGLFDDFMQNIDVQAFETPLLRIGKLVKWEIFEPILMESVIKPARGPGGRPRFHPLLMFMGPGSPKVIWLGRRCDFFPNH